MSCFFSGEILMHICSGNFDIVLFVFRNIFSYYCIICFLAFEIFFFVFYLCSIIIVFRYGLFYFGMTLGCLILFDFFTLLLNSNFLSLLFFFFLFLMLSLLHLFFWFNVFTFFKLLLQFLVLLSTHLWSLVYNSLF